MEEPYQGLPDYTDMGDVVYQENAEKAVDTYDKFVGPEVCLPDKLGIITVGRVTKRVKGGKGNPRGIKKSALFADHSLYEV